MGMSFNQINVELHELKSFIAVAEERNFSRAAERLYVEQPNLSRKIKNLEKKLNGKLFNRKKRPLTLTQAGERFLIDARSILAQLEQTVQITQKICRGEKGCLKLGFTSSIANSILPDILNTFRQDYPEVELSCRQMASDRQIKELQDNQIDVALFHANQKAIADDNLDSLVILTEPLVLVLPETHPLSNETKISLRVLETDKFVLPTRQSYSGLSEEIHRLFDRVGFIPEIAQEATNMVTVLGLVAGGMGISLLPSNAVNLQRKGVIYKEIEGLNSAIETKIVWQCNNSSNILEGFRKVTQKINPAIN